jgi:large subunit ribosomal protein L22
MTRRKKSKKDNVGSDYIVSATLRNGRIPPRKARLLLGLIKDMQVDTAMQTLRHNPRKGARIILKLLKSAVANAQSKEGIDVDALWVTGAWADMGRTLRRYMPRAQGRATPIRKKSSHITICLGEG